MDNDSNDKCHKCTNFHDSSTGREGMLCQDCWEEESDEGWWRYIMAIHKSKLTKEGVCQNLKE